jgi:hypothetical protein
MKERKSSAENKERVTLFAHVALVGHTGAPIFVLSTHEIDVLC